MVRLSGAGTAAPSATATLEPIVSCCVGRLKLSALVTDD
jgi:hypothetical protein